MNLEGGEREEKKNSIDDNTSTKTKHGLLVKEEDAERNQMTRWK